MPIKRLLFGVGRTPHVPPSYAHVLVLLCAALVLAVTSPTHARQSVARTEALTTPFRDHVDGGVALRLHSFLDSDRRYVIPGLVVFLTAQLGLVGGLLTQRIRRRRAETQVLRSEERYSRVAHARSDLICRFLPDSTLTFVNDAYCRLWRKTREELIGRKFITLVPLSARQAVLDDIAHLVRGSSSHEHPVTLPDGTLGWHHWTNHAIVDEDGELVELEGVGQDVTDRKRAEDAIEQLEARNEAVLRAIPDVILVLRRDGTYVDYHVRDEKLLFLPPEQFIGRTVRDVMPPSVSGRLMDAIERACVAGDPVVVEYELLMGEVRFFEARFVCVEHDRVLSIVRDVTDTRCAREVTRTLAGRLIVSQEAERRRIARDLHDGVCQEIASVAVDVSYLRQKGGDIRSREVQELLLSVEHRVAGVAETLRLLSHGLHPAVLQHIGLVAALQAHCAEVERQHHVEVTFFGEGDVEPASPAVSLSMFRIAQEALRNTAKHAHARHASVSLSRKDADLSLLVEDDGTGFDVSTVRQNGGLGLVSIEERARMVHGQATILSDASHGTRIDVRVPLAALAAAGLSSPDLRTR